jgi:hypothetical protein
MRRSKATSPRRWWPVRLLLCLCLLANPLLSAAAGTQVADLNEPEPAATAHPCHGAASMAASLADRPMPNCPHCAGDGPAASCTCCDLGTSSVAPLVAATPVRQEAGPATVLGRLPDTLPLSPGERLYRPPIEAI